MNLRLALCKDLGSCLGSILGNSPASLPRSVLGYFWIFSLWFLHLPPHFHLSLFSQFILPCYVRLSLPLPSFASLLPHPQMGACPCILPCSAVPTLCELTSHSPTPTLQIRFFPFSPAPPWSRPYKPHLSRSGKPRHLAPPLVQAFLLLEAALAALPHPSRHTSAPRRLPAGYRSLTGQLSTCKVALPPLRVKRTTWYLPSLTIALGSSIVMSSVPTLKITPTVPWSWGQGGRDQGLGGNDHSLPLELLL